MDAVEEVKSRLAIEDVVGEYVQLKRAGRNFKGLSPFTAEKSPSFMVSPEKGIWHDFSSGKGGNVFSFVMEVEGLDFKGALELLARKAGIDLAQYGGNRSGQSSKFKDRLYEVLELAAKFYQVQFSKHQTAIEYVFRQRAFTKETALAFQLGYAPNTGDALLNFLTQKGFSEKEIIAAGLTAKRYRGGLQDMFRGRLMIPLADAQGRVIGFTARLLDDQPNAPKYINTPQTVLYDKGRHVYGLHLAKEAIRKSGYVVMVEGNMDVVASHQAGVAQVVATAGTALTEMHLKTLKRFTGDIRAAFDQDRAGQAATERSIPIAAKVGVTLSMITIPAGKDPDELVRKDPKAWVAVIEKPQYALDWLMDRYEQQLDLGSAVGKRQFSDILLTVVRQLTDEVEREHYIGRIATTIGVSTDALLQKLQGIETTHITPRKKTKNTPVKESQIFDHAKVQNQFLALVLMRPHLRVHMHGVTPNMFVDAAGRHVFDFLLHNGDFTGQPEMLPKLWAGQPADQVQNLQEYVKMLSLQYETLYQDLAEVELQYEVASLRVRFIEQYVKHEKTKIVAALRDASEQETSTLLEQAKELDILLKITKEQ